MKKPLALVAIVIILGLLGLVDTGRAESPEMAAISVGTAVQIDEPRPEPDRQVGKMPTTTTTQAPTTAPQTVPVAPEPVQMPQTTLAPPAAAPAPSGGCVLPQYICDRESGGSYTAVNSTGCNGEGCYGAYQFAASTWDSTVQRMGRPDLVGNYLPDPATQDAVAAFLWAGGAGCSHWAAC